VGHGRSVDRHLVGAGVEQAADISDLTHAAADGERDENPAGHRLDHVQQDVALVGARGDVEEGELVGAFAVVACRDLHRIAGVAQLDEVDAFHYPAGGDVEAGDHPLGQRHGYSFPSALLAAACAFCRSILPSYSARPAMAPITPSGASFWQIASTSFRLLSPPEAMTGVFSCWASLNVASMLMPFIIPSRPMSV